MKTTLGRIFHCVLFVSIISFTSSTTTCSNGNTSRTTRSVDIDLTNLSIDEIITQIRIKGMCCVTLTQYFLDRIWMYNPVVRAVITVDEEGALRDAHKLDAHYRKTNGKLKGSLHCVPTLIKDNIFVKGLPTTLGIRLFSNATADEDAPIVARLRSEGAIILGKANMIMFAAGSTDIGSETGGLASNPYGLSYTVVGSSTGNAVALAARLAVIGIGSDSGGSITAPASATGTVGLRPPSGFSNMHGTFPLLGQPFDVVGPMALTVKDTVTVAKVIQAPGSRESLSFNGEFIRIGILDGLTYGVANVTSSTLDPADQVTISAYSVDKEVQDCFRIFEKRVRTLSNNYNIVSTTVTEDMVELAKPVLEHENYRWSCVIRDMTRFLKQRPMRSSTGELIDNATQIASHRSTPLYYRMLLGYLAKRTNACESSKDRYTDHLSTVRRRLRRQIFDQGIDLVVMPTLNAVPWPMTYRQWKGANSSNEPHSNGHLHDLGGLFALPAMNLPLCFSKPLPGATQGLPIGGYLMTLPERLGTMLEFARIYEQAYRETKMPRMFMSYGQTMSEDQLRRMFISS